MWCARQGAHPWGFKSSTHPVRGGISGLPTTDTADRLVSHHHSIRPRVQRVGLEACQLRLGWYANEPLLFNRPLAMTLANLLSADQIIPEMQARERWTAIDELVEFLEQKGFLSSADKLEVLDALKTREHTMSTGIGMGIAIPHASSSKVKGVLAAFGRSMEGIEFGALDHAPVRFVVMFVVPKDQFQIHLRTLAAIAKFLKDRDVRERLASAQSPAEILEVFRGHGR